MLLRKNHAYSQKAPCARLSTQLYLSNELFFLPNKWSEICFPSLLLTTKCNTVQRFQYLSVTNLCGSFLCLFPLVFPSLSLSKRSSQLSSCLGAFPKILLVIWHVYFWRDYFVAWSLFHLPQSYYVCGSSLESAIEKAKRGCRNATIVIVKIAVKRKRACPSAYV